MDKNKRAACGYLLISCRVTSLASECLKTEQNGRYRGTQFCFLGIKLAVSCYGFLSPVVERGNKKIHKGDILFFRLLNMESSLIFPSERRIKDTKNSVRVRFFRPLIYDFMTAAQKKTGGK